MATKVNVDKLIEDMPDTADPSEINYWVTIGDKEVYLEGWSDECLAGTGFPTMERGGTAEKLTYIEDHTPLILSRKAKERGLKLIKGGFKELEEADNLYGVTWGIYAQQSSSNPGLTVILAIIAIPIAILATYLLAQYGVTRRQEALPQGGTRQLPAARISLQLKPAVGAGIQPTSVLEF